MPANYHRTEVRFPPDVMEVLKAVQRALEANEKRFVSMSEVVVFLVRNSLLSTRKEGEKEG